MTVSRQYMAAVALLISAIGLLGMLGHEIIPSKAPFTQFPMAIESWQGQEIRLPQDVLDVLKADDVLLRAYRRPDGTLLWLYAGYYQSQRAGATYHSPLNCLPGGGWSILSREEVPVTVGGRTMRINRVLIAKGLDKQLVLYWYQDRGRIIPNEYRAKAYLIWDAMTRNRTDGALVRVSLPVSGSTDMAFRTAVDFLDRAYPSLLNVLPG
ncbi:MAG TPA: EpsI family protein [Nitrospirales bacterium]|nr:EpsI family protein [Nitrospirales bacterium]